MVNIHEAKTHLSRLVERAAAGEEIVIARAGVPVAKLGPVVPVRPARRPGIWRGLVEIRPDHADDGHGMGAGGDVGVSGDGPAGG